MTDSLFKEYDGIFDEKETSNKKEKTFEYGYSPFALQDAIGEREVKKMWLEYQKLRFAGVEAEELIHKVISKVRDMAAIKAGASEEDLGLKDYPFNKSKRDLKNWKEKDLEDFYAKLIEIYHRSRMESGDLDVAIEKTLLNVSNA